MTLQSKKPEQKRLDSCVLALPKWAKIYEKLEKRACGTLKIKDAVANAAVRVANVRENGQLRRKTTLLGKYRLKYSVGKHFVFFVSTGDGVAVIRVLHQSMDVGLHL